MPRAARKRGGSGFYHVVTKGDGGRVVFEDDSDRVAYLTLLSNHLSESSVKIHAYCLMGNHVHLLLEDKSDELSLFMKAVNEQLAMRFASKARRVGHVLQGRYWSEPIENDRRLLATVRYIHANPETAGICKTSDYPWSSYGAYMGAPSFVTTDFVMSLVNSRESFAKLHESGVKFAIPFRGSSLSHHLGTDELIRIGIEILGRDVFSNLDGIKPDKRTEYLLKLTRAGFSLKEIELVTGLGRSAIRRSLKHETRDGA